MIANFDARALAAAVYVAAKLLASVRRRDVCLAFAIRQFFGM